MQANDDGTIGVDTIVALLENAAARRRQLGIETSEAFEAYAASLVTYTAKHQRGCATERGRLCDCDPVLEPYVQLLADFVDPAMPVGRLAKEGE